VVDDEPMLLDLAQVILGRLGYDVMTFHSAKAALEAFKSSAIKPALIITDYAMHSMNGLEFIRECKRINPAQKMVLLSGTVDEQVYQDAESKPDRFLAKPYSANQLMELVQSMLAE
jgi:two-component system, cell cycle sensor histidine kinase and response regulator CckA